MPPQGLGFSFTVRKTGEVAIARHGTVVTVLRGDSGARFLADVESGDHQAVMARATGNYRRGNERSAREHPRNR